MKKNSMIFKFDLRRNMGRPPSDGTGEKTPRHDKMVLWLLEKDNQRLIANKILTSKPYYYTDYFQYIDNLTVRKEGQHLKSQILPYEILDLEIEVVGNTADCDAIMIYRPPNYNGDNSVFVAVIELKPQIISGTRTVSQIKKYMKRFNRHIRKKCEAHQIKSIDGILITHDPDKTLDPIFENEHIQILRVLEPQQKFFTNE